MSLPGEPCTDNETYHGEEVESNSEYRQLEEVPRLAILVERERWGDV